MKKRNGFTLIELMIVVSIIGILSSVAIPQYKVYVQRSELADVVSMADNLIEKVTAYHSQHYEFPINNKQAGLPPADKLIGNRVTAVYIENGAIHLHIGHKASKALQGTVLSYRPAFVEGSITSPISWICGDDKPVPGMKAMGENKTTVPDELLLSNCRDRTQN